MPKVGSPADLQPGATSPMVTTYETICGFLEKREIHFRRHEDGAIFQASPDELPDIHSL